MDPHDSGRRPLYKVVETSTVTDEELEQILNEWTGRGWRLDSIRFVTRESSRRPAMAFVLFTRERPAAEAERSAAESGGPVSGPDHPGSVSDPGA